MKTTLKSTTIAALGLALLAAFTIVGCSTADSHKMGGGPKADYPMPNKIMPNGQ